MESILGFILIIILLPQLIRIIDITITLIALSNKKLENLRNYKEGKFTVEDLNNLTPGEFELWCADFLRKQGYCDLLIASKSQNEGPDISCGLKGKKYYIKCINNRNRESLGSNDVLTVKKLHGLILHDDIKNAIIISTRRLHKNAQDFIDALPAGISLKIHDISLYEGA